MSSAEQWALEKSLQSSNFTLKLRETEYEAGKEKQAERVQRQRDRGLGERC